jgi:hypothetical protein
MDDTGNLPPWPGASTVYIRLMCADEELGRRAYDAQRKADKRKGFKFSPTEDMIEIRNALDAGNEETCKALMHRYINLWSNK